MIDIYYPFTIFHFFLIISLRQIAVAFRSWSNRTAQHASQRGPKLPRLLSRLKATNLAVALKKWARAAATLAAVERASRKVRSSMDRALKQMKHGNTVRGWRQWRSL